MKLTAFAFLLLFMFTGPIWAAVCSSHVTPTESRREIFKDDVVFGGLRSTLRSYTEHDRTAARFRVNIYVDDPDVLDRLQYRYERMGNRFVATEILSVSQIRELSFEPGIERIGASGR